MFSTVASHQQHSGLKPSWAFHCEICIFSSSTILKHVRGLATDSMNLLSVQFYLNFFVSETRKFYLSTSKLEATFSVLRILGEI